MIKTNRIIFLNVYFQLVLLIKFFFFFVTNLYKKNLIGRAPGSKILVFKLKDF